ncbi:TIGR03016 family PEP-CTERM system-associated outer membrane protein [Uliginosibacterium sp. H1]|uniref:TIGR03016 family PEP-CTERM system-associated outer membrane protein n=1 Tax=Uliginosibacterium sp. H1 TaxID=3114757 RepID=UPI002E192F11|nr:TIGR03016 family PEP-CTERM system-associated outer membrane protein [Uliginosibacterium sp. H1]
MLTATPTFVAAQSWRLGADVRVREAFTDNVRLSGTNPESDWVTEVAPGVSLSGRSARVRGNLNARLNSYYHTTDTDSNNTNLDLFGGGTVEAIEDTLFVDADARASQEVLSSFGASSPDGINTNENSAQYYSLSITPRAYWRLGSSGTGEARYRLGYSGADTSAYDTRLTHDWTLALRNGSAWGRAGWELVGLGSSNEYDRGRDQSMARLRAAFVYTVSGSLKLRLFGGQERNNFTSRDQESYTNWGGGVEWRPSERTLFSAEAEDRFFGTGYNIRFSHRRPRSSVDMHFSRDVSSNSDAINGGSSYFLLLEQEERLLESQIPDVTQRRQVAILRLALQGITPQNAAQLGGLSSTRTINRVGRITLVASGLRNDFSLSLSRLQRDTFFNQALSAVSDDFSRYGRVIDYVAFVGWNTRLSPRTSVNAGLTYTDSEGSNSGSPDTSRQQKDVTLGLNTTFGSHSNGGLQYRRSNSSGSATYTENAVSAFLAYRF